MTYQEGGHHDCGQGKENEIQEAGGGSRVSQTESQRQGDIYTQDCDTSLLFCAPVILFETGKMSN